MITLYVFPSERKGNGWNLNVWKARYSLDYKGVAYETVWVEFPDVEATCKQIGANPTVKKPDGSPLYTLPVIRDDATDAVVSESFHIAQYLDKTYSNKPTLVPAGTQAFLSKQDALWQFVLPQATWGLNPRSAEYSVAPGRLWLVSRWKSCSRKERRRWSGRSLRRDGEV